MKKIILGLLLIASFTLIAEECYRPDTSDEFESPIAYMDDVNNEELNQYFNDYTFETSEYDQKLAEYFEKHQDINIQMIGFYTSYDYEDNLNKIKKIKKVLKKAINLGANKYTIQLANNLCHTVDTITSWCHQQKIHETQVQVDPENVMTYLNKIHAEDSKDNIQEILLTASDDSTYSNIYFNYYTLELAQVIQDFNDSHPLIYSESLNDKNNYMSQFVEGIKKEIDESQLRSKGLLTKDLDLAIAETSPIIHALTTSMMTAFPPTIEFIQYCQNPIDAEDCTLIAKILVNDHSFINQGIGIQLLGISNELLGKETDEKLKNNLDSKYQNLMCYMQSKGMQIVLFVNKDIVTSYIKDSIKFGDLEAAKKIAFTVYNIEKQNGYNPDFNPNDCK